MSFKKLSFENKQGQRLAARLDLPVDEQPIAYALFAHCFTCTKNLKAVGNISRALTREGIAVLRFDFTGLGESEGDFADTNFSTNVDDLVAAAEALAAEHEAPRILVGHSMGGAAVLQAAARIASATAVATIGAPADPEHVVRHFEDSVEEIERKGEAVVKLAGRPFKIKKQFLDDLESQRMDAVLGKLNRALLIFHSPADLTVGIDNAARIFKAAKHPKSFVSLDRADHLLMEATDSVYVGTVLAAWARKYIGAVQEEVKQPDPAANGVVARLEGTGFRTEILANGHALVADEPQSFGGTNLGPSPYDLLVAGLGACTAMTLRMYASRKKWPLESTVVRLRHRKVHARDCEDCETQDNVKVDYIDRELELNGPLDEAQRERLTQIANRCPVHRSLESEVHVATRLRPDRSG